MTENKTKRSVERVHLRKPDRAGRLLLAVTPPTGATRGGVWLLDVQLSSRDLKAKGQRGLHLAPRYVGYRAETLAEVRRAAIGPHRAVLADGREVYAIRGDLAPALRSDGFIVRNIRPSPERLAPGVLARQRQTEDLARLVYGLTKHTRVRRIIGHRITDTLGDDEGGSEFGVRGQGNKPGEFVIG